MISELYKLGEVQNVLVICPKPVICGWKSKSKAFLKIKYKQFTKSKLLEIARNGRNKVAYSGTTLKLLFLNYESLISLRKHIADFKPNMVVFDESHEIKNRVAKQSKECYKLSYLPTVSHVVLLTGTPMGNNKELDLFSQFNIMDQEVLGPWKEFKRVYTRQCGYMGTDIKIKKRLLPKYMAKIKSKAFYITKQEAWDLPPEMEDIYTFEMSPQTKRHYEELEKSFYTKYNEMEASSTITIANMSKLQQLTGGYLRLDDGSLVELPQDKLKLLLSIIKGFNQDKKLVIFTRYVEELLIIEKALTKLKYKVATLYGKTKDKSIWQKFQENKYPSVIICQVATGGVGIDLFAADTAIFYSNSFSYIDYEQAKSRLHRKGQENKVTYIHLIAKDSIDVDIKNSLDSNGTDIMFVLKQLRRRLCLRKNH